MDGPEWTMLPDLTSRRAVAGVVVATSFFTGNYPPFASVEALAVSGYPSPGELSEVDWDTIVGVFGARRA